MIIEDLLARLPKVKKSGNGWIARCPAHPDKSPSLSIKEVDGKLLVHCFAGCILEDICGAVGIEVSDLFPPRENIDYQAEKPLKFGPVRFAAIDALRCLAGEGSVMLLLACDQAEGKVLSPDDRDRLATAVGRVNAAIEYLGENDIERVTTL